MSRLLTLEEFIQKAREIHNDLYDYSQVDYKKSNIKVKIYCKQCKEFFWQTPNSHLNKCGCEKCSYKLRADEKTKKAASNFEKKAREIHGDLYDYTHVVYLNAKKCVKILCNRCKKIFEQTPNNHLRGQGCSYCNGNHKKDLQYFINKSKEVHGDLYDYSEVEYKNNRIPVKILCKKCNKYFYQDFGNHICQKQGCPYCTSSRNEKIIAHFLNKNKIVYKQEKRFSDCKDKACLPFDFYLPLQNMCIEYQGKQHYKEGFSFYVSYNKNNIEKAQLDFDTIQKHDQIKRNFCKKNNIKLIEIKYNEDIIKRLEKETQYE